MSALQDAVTLAAELSELEAILADPLERQIRAACEELKTAVDSRELRVVFRRVQMLHQQRAAGMVERLERIRGLK